MFPEAFRIKKVKQKLWKTSNTLSKTDNDYTIKEATYKFRRLT